MIFTKPALKEAGAMEPEQTGTMFVFLEINWRVVEETRQMLQEVARMAAVRIKCSLGYSSQT